MTKKSVSLRLTVLFICGGVVLSGCSDDESTQDSGSDETQDSGSDETQDAAVSQTLDGSADLVHDGDVDQIQDVMPITLPTDEIQAIAKEAYIYAFPMLEFYRFQYRTAITDNMFNQIFHRRDLKTPQDTIVVSPNNDTLYTIMNLDLRAEPVIVEVPAITDRYYSLQLIDIYTHVPDFIGTRATGTEAGKYLIAGPDWQETEVSNIEKVFRMESDFVLVLGRTLVNGPADLDAAHAIQDQYKLYPLSTYTNEEPKVAPALSFPVVDETYPIDFNIGKWMIPGIPPVNNEIEGSPPYKEMSAEFISYFNFLLGKVAPVESEADLLEKFAQIGIAPDEPFDPAAYDPSIIEAINNGINDAKKDINAVITNVETKDGWTTNLDTFVYGDRAHMEGRYLIRAVGALVGFLGNPPTEAVYPLSFKDIDGEDYDGASNQYVLTFPAGLLPPIKDLGFWSLTMYNNNGFLVDNPIDRYSIGSQLNEVVLNDDESLSIYIQSSAPSDDKISNWLPAPQGPFRITLRIFLPEDSVVEGEWAPPGVVKVN